MTSENVMTSIIFFVQGQFPERKNFSVSSDHSITYGVIETAKGTFLVVHEDDREIFWEKMGRNYALYNQIENFLIFKKQKKED